MEFAHQPDRASRITLWHAEISRFLHGLTLVSKRIDFIDLYQVSESVTHRGIPEAAQI